MGTLLAQQLSLEFVHLVALLRHQLFVYRDLEAWLNEPFQPPEVQMAEQLSLELG
ncbi:MAG: hypothetical protein JNK87_09415 [Bryobacterales bacterium]|nr:hypothetical protein [Bryobacterales bacterium]